MFAAAVVALASPACRTPTTITLELRTDLPCGQVSESSIAVGKLATLRDAPAAAGTERCDAATGTIGTLVLVPSGENDAEVAVRVVTGVGKTAEDCVRDGFLGGCVVARRSLRYIPNTSLFLPVTMQASCLDLPCDDDKTCVDGRCVSATIPDSSQCTTEAGCELALGADAGPPDAGREVGAPDTGIPDVSPDTTSMMDGGADATTGDTGPPPIDGGDASGDATIDAPGLDSGSDASDVGSEGPACVSEVPGGICSTATQCGCNAGQACDVTGTGPLQVGCRAIGPRLLGELCNAATLGDCGQGDVCAIVSGTVPEVGVCRRFCDSPGVCSTGDCIPFLSSAIGICSDDCALHDPTPVCGPGATCIAQPNGMHSDCLPTNATGTGPGGCASNPFECAPGYVCVSPGNCVQWCRVGQLDCVSGACVDIGGPTIAGTAFGVCT